MRSLCAKFKKKRKVKESRLRWSESLSDCVSSHRLLALADLSLFWHVLCIHYVMPTGWLPDAWLSVELPGGVKHDVFFLLWVYSISARLHEGALYSKLQSGRGPRQMPRWSDAVQLRLPPKVDMATERKLWRIASFFLFCKSERGRHVQSKRFDVCVLSARMQERSLFEGCSLGAVLLSAWVKCTAWAHD